MLYGHVLCDGSVKLRGMARKKESLWSAYSFSKLYFRSPFLARPLFIRDLHLQECGYARVWHYKVGQY